MKELTVFLIFTDLKACVNNASGLGYIAGVPDFYALETMYLASDHTALLTFCIDHSGCLDLGIEEIIGTNVTLGIDGSEFNKFRENRSVAEYLAFASALNTSFKNDIAACIYSGASDSAGYGNLATGPYCDTAVNIATNLYVSEEVNIAKAIGNIFIYLKD